MRRIRGDCGPRQYAGDKSGLRPIYEAVVAAVRTFGDDVEIAPKKTSVSLRRSKQFALVQPSTRTRVDLGIQLKGVEPAKAAARIRADLESRGLPIGPYDVLIAATALARGAILVTHNTVELSRVAGLRLEDWY